MKKVLALCIMSVFVLSFVSCKKVAKVLDTKAGTEEVKTPPQA
ncbi:hypothetical protein AGMMS49573_05240 [Endomicrobiia bacterium]|nr:hypothetical protein AGMMS49573_05240 [Endomicrobiia bacterium]GHT24825.1 hypothetical protein AGMMS49953_08200 [Endomicrobiia bacterium]